MQSTPSINSLSTIKVKDKYAKIHDKFEQLNSVPV